MEKWDRKFFAACPRSQGKSMKAGNGTQDGTLASRFTLRSSPSPGYLLRHVKKDFLSPQKLDIGSFLCKENFIFFKGKK